MHVVAVRKFVNAYIHSDCLSPSLLLLPAGQERRQAAMTKYILVSGGVVSGIGKGVIGTRPPSYYALV